MGSKAQQPVLQCLLKQNEETFELEPLLAESYWMSADGLTMRFKLRSNVCFSDGTPVTPEDVMFSYHTIMDPGVDSAPLKSFYNDVKDCRKIDDRSIEFTMKEPYYLGLDYVGAGLFVIPEHVYKFKNGEEYNHRGGSACFHGPVSRRPLGPRPTDRDGA